MASSAPCDCHGFRRSANRVQAGWRSGNFCRPGDRDCRQRPFPRSGTARIFVHIQWPGVWHRTCIANFGKACRHAYAETGFYMGIYGALSTAVTGLQAQSFALENISGNIANSQTVGYKRVETSFEDMIPDGKPTAQPAGSVVATARATNTVQGDISTSQTATNMAINGNGFFVVAQKTGDSDGHPTFSGSPLYTRRGDFDIDKDGNLVNGAGYYLEGLPIDPTTGNVSGSVPSVVKISNSLLPALPTTRIDYQLNLPQQPQDDALKTAVPGSELLKTSDFLPNTAPAAITGAAALTGGASANTVMQPGDTLSVNIGGTPTVFTFYDGSAPGAPPANGIDVQPPTTVSGALSDLQTKLQAIGPASATATVGLDGAG